MSVSAQPETKGEQKKKQKNFQTHFFWESHKAAD